MDVSTMSLFAAILTIIAMAGAVAVAVTVLVTRGDDSEDPRSLGLRADLDRVALPLAWLVATATTLGSLYFSEVAHFTPCKLCWYQRIAMYPLVLLLGIAAWRRDRSVRMYVTAQCAVGAVIAAYHSWIQAFPPAAGTAFCTVEAPCTERYVWELGFISLPLMALTAFVTIIALLSAITPAGRTTTTQRHDINDGVPDEQPSQSLVAIASGDRRGTG